MTNKNQHSESYLEIPRKIGFGKNYWEFIETIKNTVIYAKYGKGSDNILVIIDQIKNKDTQLKVSIEGRKIFLAFSKHFDFSFVSANNSILPLTEKDEKKIKFYTEAIFNGLTPEEVVYEDEVYDLKLKDFQDSIKVVKYQSEDNEKYKLKDKEILIREDVFKEESLLLKALLIGYLKVTLNEEYDPISYLKRLEEVLIYIL